MCNTYNGWANYETWAVNLWLENEEGAYSTIREEGREQILQVLAGSNDYDGLEFEDLTEEQKKEIIDEAVPDLADFIKEYVEEQNPLSGEANMFSDLLNAALSIVEWRDIALAFLEQ